MRASLRPYEYLLLSLESTLATPGEPSHVRFPLSSSLSISCGFLRREGDRLSSDEDEAAAVIEDGAG
jgi:hypothetical protein